MTTYQTLLFDVDDTLLDFKAAEKLALRLLFEEKNIVLTNEIEENYKKINTGLWKQFEEGVISRDEVLNSRFSLLFANYEKELDGVDLEKSYRSYLGEGSQLINGAKEIITDLHGNYDLFIVTNGVSKTQYKRLLASGLHAYFKDIFVSEDTGYQKPMKEYFDFVFSKIPNLDIKKTLIIGDSLSSDIKGGNLAGIDTCWFNPSGNVNKTDITPTYEIQDLKELYNIVK